MAGNLASLITILSNVPILESLSVSKVASNHIEPKVSSAPAVVAMDTAARADNILPLRASGCG